MKTLSCREAGKNCDYVAKGKTEDEVIKTAIDHAIDVHKMKASEFVPEMRMKMRSLIHEEQTAKSAEIRMSS